MRTDHIDDRGEVFHFPHSSAGMWDPHGTKAPSAAGRGDACHILCQGSPALDRDRIAMPVSTKGGLNYIGWATATGGIVRPKHQANPVVRPTFPWEQPYLLEFDEGGEQGTYCRRRALEARLMWQPPVSRFVTGARARRGWS